MDGVNHYRTNNVDEAVALAERFKAEGKYNWFRGQRQNWWMKPTVARLTATEQAALSPKYERYIGWLSITPGLERLAEDPNAAFAIAQHHGMPTSFIDFTTEPSVAGFFASGKADDEGEDACIICIDTADLLDFWTTIPEDYKPIELVTVDVPNLWRLEAQHGVFLYCPYENFETVFYDCDRILFPTGSQVATPEREQIYPRQSSLETLLQQFVMNEQLIVGTEAARPFMREETTVYMRDEDGFDGDVIRAEIQAAPSWDPDRITSWLSPPAERFDAAYTTLQWRVPLRGQELTDRVLEGMGSTPNARMQLVKFAVDAPTEREAMAVGAVLEKFWDGVRRLPYSDDDIAAGLGTVVASYLRAKEMGGFFDDAGHPTVDLFGESMIIEFGAEDGSYARGFVSFAGLRDALREDLPTYVLDQWKPQIVGNVFGTLQVLRRPRLLFDFDRFARLFVREIVPSQVLTRAGEKQAIFYSPARLTRFGLA